MTVVLLSVLRLPWVLQEHSLPQRIPPGPNSAPVAVNDGPHSVHGSLLLPQVMTNDSDPDGDTIGFDIIGTNPTHGNLSFGATPGVIQFDIIVTPPSHGNVFFPDGVNLRYTPSPPYVGPDSFTYRIKDSLELTAIGTVNINVVNQPPTPVTDNYTVHGPTMLLPHPKPTISMLMETVLVLQESRPLRR